MEIRRPQDFGLAVSESRRRVGLTQMQLSEDSSIDRTYLAKLESGLSTVLLERAIRLLRKLGARVIVEFPADRSATTAGGKRASK